MVSGKPYVSRPVAEQWLAALGAALKQPGENPVVFHVWGIGGVGKSTLTWKAMELGQQGNAVAWVAFGETEGIEEPIPLMAKLYEQIAPVDEWTDPFWSQYQAYFDTIHQLRTEAATGRGAAGPEQVEQVQTLLRLGVDVVGLGLSEPTKRMAAAVVERGVPAAAAALSLKDSLQQLLQQHRATKRDRGLQRLLLEPLPQLTRAFVAGLAHHSQKRGILLVLDTYEKAPPEVDGWLWRSLLANTDLPRQRVRLVVAGRHCLLRGEGWRKLQQDHNWVYERTIERFTLAETTAYLAQIEITDGERVERIYGVTRGLPYYLNWVRDQTERGYTLDFDQGNEAVVRLLLQGLNETQLAVVQGAACCRWFDAGLIRLVVEEMGLDFATAVDEGRNCFGWLTGLSFVEPVGKRWRLDDVARDVFRQSLDRETLGIYHARLATECRRRADQEVFPTDDLAQRYDNPAWREWISESLYHRFFTQDPALELDLIGHLLEAHYFRKDDLIQTPLRATTAEFTLDAHPLLSHRTQKLLQDLQPAILHGWAVLEQDRDENSWFWEFFNLSKAATDRAVARCLGQRTQLTGFAQALGLYYSACRCPADQKVPTLRQAFALAQTLVATESPEYLAEFYLWKIGNKCFDLEQYEEAIAAYDTALLIKPDDHETWDNRGYALAKAGRIDEGIENFDRAIALNPSYANAVYNKAYAMSLKGDLQATFDLLAQAFALDPSYREMAKTDADFDGIRGDGRFRALVEGE